MLIDILRVQSVNNDLCLTVVNDEYDKDLLEQVRQYSEVNLIKRKPGTKDVRHYVKLNLFIFSKRFDVIHCHNHNMIKLIAPYYRKRSLLTIHDTGIQSSYLDWYKQTFAISESVQLDVCSRVDIVPSIIENGIAFEAVGQRSVWEVKGTFRIIQVSRLAHLKKGQHIVIEALRILKENGIVDIKVDFVGEGESFDFLSQLVKKYHLEDRVRFLGLRQRKYIYRTLKEYDLLVQPSLNEGFGLTAVEGIAARIPTLVSNIEGPMEIIRNGKYGFHFETNNPVKLAETIIAIKNTNQHEMNLFLNRAYKYAIDRYDINETARKYLKVYHRLIKYESCESKFF